MTTCHILHSLSPIILLQFNATWLVQFHKPVIPFCKILWILCPLKNFFQGNLQATISYTTHSLFQHAYSITLSSPLCSNYPMKHEATHYTHNFPQTSGTSSLTSQTVLLSKMVFNAFSHSNRCSKPHLKNTKLQKMTHVFTNPIHSLCKFYNFRDKLKEANLTDSYCTHSFNNLFLATSIPNGKYVFLPITLMNHQPAQPTFRSSTVSPSCMDTSLCPIAQ